MATQQEKAAKKHTPAAEPWYKKAFTVKYDLTRSESILAYLQTIPKNERPANATELIVKLLETVATLGDTAPLNEQIERLTLFQQKSDEAISELNTKTEGLQQENTRLQAENEELKKPETIRQQWFESLQAVSPEIAAYNDATLEDALKRYVFVITQMHQQVNEAAERENALAEELQASENRPVLLKPNEAIMTFNETQLNNIRLIRQMMEKMGHTFKTKEPAEVIHLAVEQNIELTRTMIEQVKEFQPLIELLTATA